MIVQYGVIPWRRAERGIEILLITSRETRRWVVPRGNPMPGLRSHEAAAEEAYEEAGIRGSVGEAPFGRYGYDKRRRDGSAAPAEVELYAMAVSEELASWPEQHQRERRWFTPAEAASAVDEAELGALFLALEATANHGPAATDSDPMS